MGPSTLDWSSLGLNSLDGGALFTGARPGSSVSDGVSSSLGCNMHATIDYRMNFMLIRLSIIPLAETN